VTRLKDRRNKRAFGRAVLDCGDDEQVCATLDQEGTPVYFAMPKSATDADVRAKAFELREGRSLSGVEKSLIRIVERDLPDVEH